MSLKSIIDNIFNEANTEKEKIIAQARIEAEKIISLAKKEAEEIYQNILAKEQALYESHKQKLLVQARLEARRQLLQTRQKLIGQVFEKLMGQFRQVGLKKQQIYPDKVEEVAEDIDFYLNKIRADYEAEIAKILFE